MPYWWNAEIEDKRRECIRTLVEGNNGKSKLGGISGLLQTTPISVNFAADVWEKTRMDGTRALSWNAVPTIFSLSGLKTSGNV
nr:unnamed protein product [Callosobruchus analis]